MVALLLILNSVNFIVELIFLSRLYKWALQQDYPAKVKWLFPGQLEIFIIGDQDKN